MAKSGKPRTKSAIVTRMLGRERGASVVELTKTTGWKDHSVRALLTGIRKTAELIKEERPDGSTAYRLALAAGAADAPEEIVKEAGE